MSTSTSTLLPDSREQAGVPGRQRLTIAHDYFTQRGGAERVAAALVDKLHPDRVVTALYNRSETFEMASKRPDTSMLQRVGWFRRDPRKAFLLFPLAWRTLRPAQSELLICSSSGWSHAMRKGHDTLKIVYCHNPPRWIHQPDDYLRDYSRPVQVALRAVLPLLKRWDASAAKSADLYIANSTAVAARVASAYGIRPVVVHPPMTLDIDGDLDEVPGVEPGFFLSIGRTRGYKNTRLLVDAFRRMPHRRLVIVGDQSIRDAPSNVTNLGRVSDARLRWLYTHARALLTIAREDFGLTPIEANAFGTPALAIAAGGFLDSIRDGVNGRFIRSETLADVEHAVEHFDLDWDGDAVRRYAESFSINSFVAQLEALAAGLESSRTVEHR